MFVKFIGEGSPPLVGRVVVPKTKPAKVRNTDKLKNLVDNGYKFVILKDGDWVDAEDYFNKSEDNTQESIEEVSEIEVIDEEPEDIHPYAELYEGHWTKQVSKVKEFSDNPEVIGEVYEYGLESGASEGVLDRIKEYLDELKN